MFHSREFARGCRILDKDRENCATLVTVSAMAVTFCRSEIRLVASALPNTVPNMLLSRGHTGDVMPSLMSESEQGECLFIVPFDES